MQGSSIADTGCRKLDGTHPIFPDLDLKSGLPTHAQPEHSKTTTATASPQEGSCVHTMYVKRTCCVCCMYIAAAPRECGHVHFFHCNLHITCRRFVEQIVVMGDYKI